MKSPRGLLRILNIIPGLTARVSLLWILLPLLMLPDGAEAQFTYVVDNGAVTITGGCQAGAVSIPSTINGLPVTSIGDYAFFDCHLTSVTIGNGVTSIGDSAFAACTILTSVTIPDSVTDIGNSAFEDCDSLGTVTIGNGVTSIGDYAFSSCTDLTSVTIPDGVTRIGTSAFEGCSLTSITMPNSVTRIGDNAFKYCTSLGGVYLQGNAPGVGLEPFYLATVYYLPGTAGWGPRFGGRPTALWVLATPVILGGGPSFSVQANRFGFRISWATNIPVVVEATRTLMNPIWSPISTNTLTGGTSDFSDPQWAQYPTQFYRLRSP